MRTLLLSAAFILAACSGDGADVRARRHAAARLSVDAASLRVTSQSNLDSQRHTFHLVTSDGHPPLIVVVPRDGGEPFDSETRDAFDRVTRAENATQRLSQIGPERVALWFAALGGGRCPMPASDQAHFTEVEKVGDGVRIAYPVAKTVTAVRRCVIDLAADGTLGAQQVTEHARAEPAARWKSDS